MRRVARSRAVVEVGSRDLVVVSDVCRVSDENSLGKEVQL